MDEREAPRIWEKTLAVLRDMIDEKNFNMWFKPLKFVSITNNTLNIE
ncbi:MAG TPA: hypothetical protein EYP78_01760, partial [Candidatus Omnitrophica bacterium]|nr:hypothetical protein [Candidatus Omnitrophota bacterium]